MSRKIHRVVVDVQKLDRKGGIDLLLPFASEILSVGRKGSDETVFDLWYRFDPNFAAVKRRIVVVGTGRSYDPDGMKFVGTVVGRELVWHVFDAGER